MDILIPVLTVSALGLIFGLGLAYALKIFYIQVDPVVEQLASALPGANCGACGYAGCYAFAEALAKNKANDVTRCAPGGKKVHERLAQILGMQFKEATRLIAAVVCNGGVRAVDKYVYLGPLICSQSGMLSGGHKLCEFGCLGFGDCARVCPFNAITMGEENLPVINRNLCTGCGRCVKACPKNIIKLIPYTAGYYVKCYSTDKGPVVMKACKAGCIACKKCELTSKAGAFKVTNNLAAVDFGKLTEEDGKLCAGACPTKVIVHS